MNKLTISKVGCGLLLGLLVPTGAGYSADANDHIQRNLDGDNPSLTSNYEAASQVRGAQGPIRSDLIDEHAALSARYPYAEDAPAYRFAYPEDAPVSSASASEAEAP